MKKNGVINSDISRVISLMGHFDTLGIGDAGMPVPTEIEKIDLAISKGNPKFIDVLENVTKELEIQKIYLAKETEVSNPLLLQQIKEMLPETPIEFISHDNMKKALKKSKAFIRTGEMTPFANVILESGVIF